MSRPSFVQRIHANTGHWLRAVRSVENRDYSSLDPEWPNILQAIQFGLTQPETLAGAAELWQAMVGFVESRGYLGSWLTFAERIARRVEELPASVASKVANELGFFFRRSLNNEQAFEMHRIALARARENGNQFEEALAVLGMGNVQVAWEKFEEAESNIHTALQILEGSKAGQLFYASGLNLLGLIRQSRGAYAEAEDYFKRGFDIYIAAAHKRKAVMMLQNLSMAQRLGGDPERSIETLSMCESLLDPVNDVEAWAQLYLALGAAYFAQGDFKRAKACFLEIDLTRLEKLGLLDPIVWATNNLGNVALKEQDWALARDYLSYSAGISRQLGMHLALANTLGDLGEALAYQGEKKIALGYLDEAILLLRRFPENAWARNRLQAILVQRKELTGKQSGYGITD